MSIYGLLFQWASTKTIQLSVLVQYKADLIIISLKIKLFSPWYSWKIAELALNNNHSLTINQVSDTVSWEPLVNRLWTNSLQLRNISTCIYQCKTNVEKWILSISTYISFHDKLKILVMYYYKRTSINNTIDLYLIWGLLFVRNRKKIDWFQWFFFYPFKQRSIIYQMCLPCSWAFKPEFYHLFDQEWHN